MLLLCATSAGPAGLAAPLMHASAGASPLQVRMKRQCNWPHPGACQHVLRPCAASPAAALTQRHRRQLVHLGKPFRACPVAQPTNLSSSRVATHVLLQCAAHCPLQGCPTGCGHSPAAMRQWAPAAPLRVCRATTAAPQSPASGGAPPKACGATLCRAAASTTDKWLSELVSADLLGCTLWSGRVAVCLGVEKQGSTACAPI